MNHLPESDHQWRIRMKAKIDQKVEPDRGDMNARAELLDFFHAEQMHLREHNKCSFGCNPCDLREGEPFAFNRRDLPPESERYKRTICKYTGLPCPRHEEEQEPERLKHFVELFGGINA